MIVNFRTREISRGAHKLTRTPIIIIIIKNIYIYIYIKARHKAEFAIFHREISHGPF